MRAGEDAYADDVEIDVEDHKYVPLKSNTLSTGVFESESFARASNTRYTVYPCE